MELRGTFIRRGSAFYPANAMAEEEMRQFPAEQPVRIQAKTTRSAKQLNFVWALATLVADGMGDMADKEDGMQLLCVEAKHMKVVHHPATGEWEAKRKSIANLGGEKFKRLITRMVHVIVRDILPGVERRALRQRIEEVLAGDKHLPEHLKAFDEAANASLEKVA